MNTYALARKIRSLYFRRRLARDLPLIEETVRAELCSRGLTRARLEGFIVRLDGENLVIEPTKAIPPGQLRLPGVKNR